MVRRRGKSKKISEVDLGKAMVSYLEASGWDVYQEVTLHSYIADIVVVNGPVVGVIEMKTSMTMTVLGQARRWLPYANLVWVAVPKSNDYAYDGALWVCQSTGVGLFTVTAPGYRSVDGGLVSEDVSPDFRRKRVRTEDLRRVLRPEHKTFAAAGAPNGKVWTPFKATAQDLHSHLGWLRHWFQPCTDAQLVHIADLVTRALNREFNKSPEEQLFKLVVLDVGTVRARYIIDQIEKRSTLAAPKKPLGKRTVVRRARALIQSARDR